MFIIVVLQTARIRNHFEIMGISVYGGLINVQDSLLAILKVYYSFADQPFLVALFLFEYRLFLISVLMARNPS